MNVYCKKTYKLRKGRGSYSDYFEENKWYEIYLEYDDSYWIFVDNKKSYTHMFRKGSIIINGCSDLFNEYFYTEKESRRLKINKINELH